MPNYLKYLICKLSGKNVHDVTTRLSVQNFNKSSNILKITGLPLVFSKHFIGFPNFYKVFKSTHFGSFFSLNLCFVCKSVLSSIKTLKRYCKVTLN